MFTLGLHKTSSDHKTLGLWEKNSSETPNDQYRVFLCQAQIIYATPDLWSKGPKKKYFLLDVPVQRNTQKNYNKHCTILVINQLNAQNLVL